MRISDWSSDVCSSDLVPLLRDLPFIHKLTVEGAVRYSDYSDFESTTTWKVGGTWMPFSELTLRAVRSRSVRVPNFGERYSARAVQEIGVRDARSEEHTSELQSLMRISYAVSCLTKINHQK